MKLLWICLTACNLKTGNLSLLNIPQPPPLGSMGFKMGFNLIHLFYILWKRCRSCIIKTVIANLW